MLCYVSALYSCKLYDTVRVSQYAYNVRGLSALSSTLTWLIE